MKRIIRFLFGEKDSEKKKNVSSLVDEIPRGKGRSAAKGRDNERR